MDSYRRFINRDLPWVERSCTSKAPFRSRSEARSYIRSGFLTAGSSLRAYRCPFEDHWHLGHRRCRHRPSGAPDAPGPRRHARLDDGLGWTSAEWWSVHVVSHVRPARDDCAWRDAWAPA